MTGHSRRAISAIAAVLVVALIPVDQGLAHRGSHSFDSVLRGISPAVLGTGIEARMLDFDSRIRLRNRSGKLVMVEGYRGEPYARLDPDGRVFLNARSPAFYLNNDRYARTPVDPSVDVSASPKWIWIANSGELTWYDRRSHYMNTGTPPQLKNPAKRTKIRNYRIPLTVGGRPATLDGTLYWVGRKPFPVGLFVGLLLATFICALIGVAVLVRLRRAGNAPDQDDDDGSPAVSPGSPAG